eukprot:m.87789 g.87789  ORF g.87789 m.87789 type:complete len:500 (+) comp13129_c2_seq6:234-1733(+)
MHISIPDSEELIEGGKKFVSYNIHINGTYHCSARFSILHTLHERLKKQFGMGCLEQFPAKNLFYMKPEAAHLRRHQLQRWLQKIGAQPIIVNGETFQTFLLNAQKEVQKGPEEDVQLEIFLVNGKSIKVDIVSTDQTDDVLETAASVIGLQADLTYYFGLYLVEDVTGKVTIRKLQDFESPYVSLKRADPEHRVQLRKAYWSPSMDKNLYDDAIALNLIYIETIADIKKGTVSVTDDVADDLANFRAQKDRQAFLSIASKLKGYSHTAFGSAISNFPEDNTKCKASLGAFHLVLTLENGKEHIFQVQRMRCWRTSSIPEDKEKHPSSGYPEIDGKQALVEMEFEYFFEQKQKMGWVKLVCSQTIHIAMCLQFMVEEMLRLKRNQAVRKPSDRIGTFKPRVQRQKKGVDLNFLTADGDQTDEQAAQQSALASILGSSKRGSVSVTLSELMRRVKAQDDTDKVDVPIDVDAIEGEAATAADPDDYNEEDDDKNAFASMAGF